MPLDITLATSLTEQLNEAFAAIGRSGATTIPSGRPNAAETAAYEYHVASHLLRIAETRRKRAHAAAVKAGVMFDHEKQPEPVGTERVVYAGQLVEVSVTVAAPIVGLDHLAFVVGLLEAGVKASLVRRLQAKYATETRASHRFTSSLVTG